MHFLLCFTCLTMDFIKKKSPLTCSHQLKRNNVDNTETSQTGAGAGTSYETEVEIHRYKDHSIIKDTNSCEGKTVGENNDTFRTVSWYLRNDF